MTISTVPPDRNSSLSSMRYDPRFQVETRSDDFDLTSGLRLIRRRAVMIVAIVALLMVAAAAAISGLKPTFHAESRLIIHTPLATTLGADDSGRNDPLNATSETERLLSRSIAERVIRDLRLDEWPEFNPALQKASLIDEIRGILRGLVDQERPSSSAQTGIEPIIPRYYKALRVWRDGQGDVIQIGFDASDPRLAAAVPNRLISIYLEERKEGLRSRLDAAEDWILQRIAEQQIRVKAARYAADQYQKTMELASNDDAEVEAIKSTMELGERRAKIEQSRAEARATISAMEAGDDASLALQNITIPDSIATMQRELRVQEQDLERLLETYGNTAEAVVDARARIVKSRTDLNLAVDRYLQSIRAKLATLDHEDDAVRAALAVAHEKRSRVALAQTELARLQRMTDKEQTALDRLEEQRRGLAGQAMLPGAELEVLSPAAVPLAPQGRGRLFYLAGALLASISIAVSAAFVVEMMDKSVRSFDQVAGMSRIIPAGFIPHLKRKDRENPSILFAGTQDGMFEEAIRNVLISLKQSNGGKLPNSIVVTSAHSGEGKSLVARSLAIELAASGSPVLLVDGDLRRGNLNSIFKSELDHGLNEFLSGLAGLQDIIHHHPSGIDFIPAGNPSLHRHAHSRDAADIVEMARARGKIVIFDTAPVLASLETMHLTAVAERTLVVAKWGGTSRRALEFCLQQLKSSQKSELFVTINNVNPKQHAKYNFSDSELFASSLMKYHDFQA
ncbi:exopolysaccharide biosynthesis protein [Rhizobium sp. R634]|uniref:GumC family protein n=1 Tax=Rhizobium sp. R634 TaxID=1764274 RepID=UPI000B52B5F1|nr:tyrosine-protein kinase domain-containing protein [Rhizobium sp. R634]OWV82025.1 exopolysaccharide biosynthesis protein [Rhizobium sp. R634]